MSTYRGKRIWKRNLLVLRRSLPILLGMAGLIFIAFPLSFLPDLTNGKVEAAQTSYLFMAHGLLLLGSLLPCLAILSSWLEENSSELLHAAVKTKKTPCLGELLWVLRFYVLIIVIPIAGACILLQLPLTELLRELLELIFVFCVYYLLISLLRSALLGVMIMTLYTMFCILECRSTDMQRFCIFRPDLLCYEGFFSHEGVYLLPSALLCGIAGYLIEKNTAGINR